MNSKLPLKDKTDAQWKLDSGRMELLVQCAYPTAEAKDNLIAKIQLKNCLLQGDLDCKPMFHHAPTTNGICSVFNGEPFDLSLAERTLKNEWAHNFKSFYSALKVKNKNDIHENGNLVTTSPEKTLKERRCCQPRDLCFSF